MVETKKSINLDAEDSFMRIVAGRIHRRFAGDGNIHVIETTVREHVNIRPGQHEHHLSITGFPQAIGPLREFFASDHLKFLKELYQGMKELSELENFPRLAYLDERFIQERLKFTKLSFETQADFIRMIGYIDLILPRPLLNQSQLNLVAA